MPSNEQRRQTAKRKLERQLARRAEQAKRAAAAPPPTPDRVDDEPAYTPAR